MKWGLRFLAAIFAIGVVGVIAIYAFYGSLGPCQIFKQDYVAKRAKDLEQSRNLESVGPIPVTFIYRVFIDGDLVGDGSWQCVKNIAKLKLNRFETFREGALWDSIGRQVPDFSLPALPVQNGAALSSDRLSAGKPTIVNFFASWCGPCREEAPLLQQLQDTTDVPLIGINYMDQPAAAGAWLSRYGNPYDSIAMDPSGETSEPWRIIGLPETFIFDGSGRIAYRVVGRIDQAILTHSLLPMIEVLSE